MIVLWCSLFHNLLQKYASVFVGVYPLSDDILEVMAVVNSYVVDSSILVNVVILEGINPHRQQWVGVKLYSRPRCQGPNPAAL